MDINKRTKYDKGIFAERKPRITEDDKKAMAAYYKAGQDVGKTADQILTELEGLYPRCSRQIQRYITYIKNQVLAEERRGATNVPTWFPFFAARLKSLLQLPSPAEFVVFATEHGEHYVDDQNYGGTISSFYWDSNPGEATTIQLYEFQTDSFIEESRFFKAALKVNPRLEELLSRYKECGAEYVLKANTLLLSMIDQGKQMVIKLVSRKLSDDVIQQIFRDKPSAKTLYFFFEEGKLDFLILKCNFFTTAYGRVIRTVGFNTGHYSSKPTDDYRVTKKEHHFRLSLGHLWLADGSKEDMHLLIDIHRSLEKKYVGEQSQLVKAVLESAAKAFDVTNKLLSEL
jgi:hypothetical protein